MITIEQKKELTNLIEFDNGINWWNKDLFVKNIQDKLPGYLKIISLPPDSKNNYNCFVYAFGLENESEFLGGNNPIQQEFIKYLILNNVLQETDHKKDSLILYLNDNQITHAGIMKNNNIVISKWMWGPIIENEILDTPSSFGGEIKFFKKLTPSDVKKIYFNYKSTGVKIKEIY